MPRACSICSHAEREAIDRALTESTPNRRIAAQFGVTEQALRRHKAGHLPAALVNATKAHEAARADTLLDQVRHLQKKALGILAKAEAAGDLRAATAAIREARGSLELLAKLVGELDERPTVSVLVAPEWITLRTLILQTLEPYAEAKAAR